VRRERPRRLALAASGLLLLSASCSKPDETIFENRAALRSGEGRAFNLQPGSYKLDLSAAGGVVSVEWIGGECPRVDSTRSLSTTCRIDREGQLVIRNTKIGAGDIDLTVKVVRLGREPH